MSMLTAQIDELRLMGCGQAAKGEFAVATLLREAADTIENLRDRLQELQGVMGESRYTALFGTPEKMAQTLAKALAECDGYGWRCDRCDFSLAPCCPRRLASGTADYDTLLEWLRGDAE